MIGTDRPPVPRDPVVILTATAAPHKTKEFWQSWLVGEGQKENVQIVMIGNGPESVSQAAFDSVAGIPRLYYVPQSKYLGVVPAFARGLRLLGSLGYGADTRVMVLHDDVELMMPPREIDEKYLRKLLWARSRGLIGFCGALGLGREDLRDPKQHEPENYSPYHLVRRAVRSNMRDAEAHGVRSTKIERVAVFDGFSQCGRLKDLTHWFYEIEHWGVVHHAYDAALGALCFRDGLEAWYVPVPCHHAGGRTAVSDTEYQKWASEKIQGGDQGFWTDAHWIVWQMVNHLLPITVEADKLIEGGGRSHRG